MRGAFDFKQTPGTHLTLTTNVRFVYEYWQYFDIDSWVVDIKGNLQLSSFFIKSSPFYG